jgi:hypothetical protein
LLLINNVHVKKYRVVFLSNLLFQHVKQRRQPRFELIDDAKIQQIQMRRMDFFRAVRKTVRNFSDCPKNRPTAPLLVLKNALKSQRGQSGQSLL